MELLHEIFDTIKKNKLRTFLTGFSVAWGIFMLIILLGAGNGLKNGVNSNFTWRAINSMNVQGGRTSMPYAGIQKGRGIKLDHRDVELLSNVFTDRLYNISPLVRASSQIVSHKKEFGNYRVAGVFPNIMSINNMYIKAGNGRFINSIDITQQRKVIVIHESHAKVLFRNESPIGKYVNVDKIPFMVIGVYSDNNERFSNDSYAPFSTIVTIYNKSMNYGQLLMLTNNVTTVEEAKELKDKIYTTMGRMHYFDSKDRNAIYCWDDIEGFIQTNKIFTAINLFVWIVGIGTLIAGIVGVSNIMLITVKERTKEFGIRKAIGATPVSILRLIIVESVIITALFGYLGMVMGIGLTEGINHMMEMAAAGQEAAGGGQNMSIFKNPTVGLGIVSAATSIIVFAGVIAGYFPAKKAVSVKPIEALHYE